MPLEEADIRQDLAKAGVYWELSPLSLSRLRFQVKCTAANLLGCPIPSRYLSALVLWCLNVQLCLFQGSQVCEPQVWHRTPHHSLFLVLQTTLEELKELHRNRLRQSSAAFIQQAWRAHQSRKRHLAYRKNSAAQVTLAQGRLLQA